MSNDRIKVVGYSQQVVYNNEIEWRPFSPDLVGVQLASNGGTPLFTMGNFSVTTNVEPKINKTFVTNNFSNFTTLSSIDLTLQKTLDLLTNNAGVILNLDKRNLSNYALFNTFSEYIRVALENIITNWPAALYMNPLYAVPPLYNTQSGSTFEGYSYDMITNVSTFKVNTNVINNKYQINFLQYGTIQNTFNSSNDLRNLTANYTSYSVLFNSVEYPITAFTAATNTYDDYIYINAVGDLFSGNTSGNQTYHIKVNKENENLFFNALPDFEVYLLNRLTNPKYTSDFNFTVKSDGGAIIYSNEKLTWPTTDGYNLDFDTSEYITYATKLLNIATQFDSTTSNLMIRFLVPDSITDFDTTNTHLDSLDVDTSGQKVNKTLTIYGVEYDKINQFIDGIRFANTVTYNKQDNMPDIYLKNLARVLGWELVSSVLENNLLKSYIDPKPSTYAGQSVGLTAVEADVELWRRIILNSPWLWKSKGTRKAIEFLFKFIGTPLGLISFNEYVYVAENQIDINQFQETLQLNGLSTDISLYPVSYSGYPNPLPNTSSMYFQGKGLWTRETGGPNSTFDINVGNNPHAGPYDGGAMYIDQFKNLIPNFTGTTVTNETSATTITNLFSNNIMGTFEDVTQETHVDINITDISGTNVNDCYSYNSDIITDLDIANDALSINLRGYDYCNSTVNFSGITINSILNAKDDGGEIFTVIPEETTTLSIEFDYLFKFKCDELRLFNASEMMTVFESLSASASLCIKDNTSLTTVYNGSVFNKIGNGNCYEYIKNTGDNSGFYVCGTVDGDQPHYNYPLNLYTLTTIYGVLQCSDTQAQIVQGLFQESKLKVNELATFKANINENSFASNMLHYRLDITDPNVISKIVNKKIVLGLNVSGVSSQISVVIDNVKLNKVSTKIETKNVFVTQPVGFVLDRVKDNKKSWVSNETEEHRTFGIYNVDKTLEIRQTDYIALEDKVINSKEIDLDIELASAVETDVWLYVKNNDCILSAKTTSATTCGDDSLNFNSLLTQSLSGVSTLEDFEYFITSELIDAKDRKILKSYPTLRALYDRYVNSVNYCGTKSSGYDYFTMDQFSKLIGNYWVDLIEQVIPATTIWGSTKLYSNTIFDNQKFQYKSYTSLFGANITPNLRVLSPASGSTSVDVHTTVIKGQSDKTLEFFNLGDSHEFDNLYLLQINSGSEFVGTVNIIKPNGNNPYVIVECSLNADIISTPSSCSTDNGTATVKVYGANSLVSILWSNGATTQTITGLSAGTYSVTVSEIANPNCNITKYVTITNVEYEACWYTMVEKPEFVQGSLTCGVGYYDLIPSITFSIETFEVNGVELINSPLTGFSKTITSGTTHFISADNSLVSGCTTEISVGYTYTDFVDFLNDTFTSLALDYKAQVSLIDKQFDDKGFAGGFYIVRPVGSVFNFVATSDVNTDYLEYSNNGLIKFEQSNNKFNLGTYYGSICDNLNIVCDTVIEHNTNPT